MNRPILLHVGFHKTGTTYLQDHVFGAAGRGFSSPWGIRGGEAIAHFVLTHPMRFSPEEAAHAFFDAVDSLAPPTEGHAVISHEDLCGHPVSSRYYGHEVAVRLHRTFPNARILIGIREQRSMLRSLWGQYVKQDGEWPMAQFFGTGSERVGFMPACRLDHFEYDLLINQYLELFGRDRVLVLPYESLRRDPLGYEQAVHDFCGTGLRAARSQPASNVGMGALTLRLRRNLNRFAKIPPIWSEYRSLPLSYRAKQRLCRNFQRIIPASWHEQEERRIGAFIDARVGGYFKHSNRRLSELMRIDLGELGYDT